MAALSLLRRLVLTDDRIEVAPDNKEAYREPAADDGLIAPAPTER